MSETVDDGITVTEIAAMGQPVAVAQETTAAVIGRALRGPVNTPLLVRSMADYRRHFGGIWARSSLGPAVSQFFDHGGQQLYVVRVANQARGAMLCLPASGSAVVLRAVEPGSTERIRAAVDYDGLDDDDEHFNLTLQRLDPETARIVDQEFYRRVSYKASAENFVGNALLTSTLARLQHPYASHRPEPTWNAGRHFESSYVDALQPGTDGRDLTDYDLIGSRKARTGLFALDTVENFDLLYLPPPGKGVDAGPTAILAAELYCRHRRAMLVVDPDAAWSNVGQAIRGVRERGYASPNMLSYFPRVTDRGDAAAPSRPAGGAIAGLLAKLDRTLGPWQDLDQACFSLQSRLQPAVHINDDERRLLHRAGLNALVSGPARRAQLAGSVTLSRGSEAHREFASLPVRRFCLNIVNAIATAARWAVFESHNAALEQKIRSQVLAYFYALDDLGAFADQRFVVQCDAGANRRGGGKEHGITLLLVFHPSGSNEPISLTLHLTASGCRVGSTAFAPSIENCA